MYKVIQDPEGTVLEKSNENSGPKYQQNSANRTEEDYKRKIESLNVEIKALTDTVRTILFIIRWFPTMHIQIEAKLGILLG